MLNFETSATESVLHMFTNAGVRILTPQTLTHGGSFAMAPIVGETPKGAPFKLPENGVIQTLNDVSIRNHFMGRRTDGGTVEVKLNFDATKEFPWWYQVHIETCLYDGGSSLSQRMVVTRHAKCRNSEQMPVSFGFQLYLATNGQSFSINHSGTTLIETERSARKKIAELQLPPSLLSLVRPDGVIEVECKRSKKGEEDEKGFDTFVVSSKDLAQHVCIKPVSGLQPLIELGPGEKVAGKYAMRYKPNQK